MTLPMPGTLICETVTADWMADLRRARDQATAADMVELRLDGVTDSSTSPAHWRAGRSPPSSPAGPTGRAAATPAARSSGCGCSRRLSDWAPSMWISSGARTGARSSAAIGRRLFCPCTTSMDADDLEDRVGAMRQTGADIVKVAVPARRLTDCLTLRDAVRGAGRVVAIARQGGEIPVLSTTAPPP